MSERILRALMQLFAIIAQVDENSEDTNNRKGRKIIESFLNAELNTVMVQEYLSLFDDFVSGLQLKNIKKDNERKRTSLNSVKVLRICTQINEELTQRQKIIVLIRIIEFIQANDNVTLLEIEFVDTVADSFYIDRDDYSLITRFVTQAGTSDIQSPNVLYITSRKKEGNFMYLSGLDEDIRILYLENIHTLFLKYPGKDELTINGQFAQNNRTHILNQGSTVKTAKSKHIYYTDILSFFLKLGNNEQITFQVSAVSYTFKSGKTAIHPFDFKEESGKMVGIMGGSGTGKSTLLNVLNGTFKPDTGTITINGIDIHQEHEKLQGLIGFVSQDDLLIEELSVYQNLLYSAKLSYPNLSEREINKKVLQLLQIIGLQDVKDLTVGNPMQKMISGGQRKRLNIALELIREPEILFLDEPTSGLSSRDSENIMDLLKEMTFKGKLIFVVIHQPSSEIFKMFDRLLLMDQGGYLIYDGNPIDALVYFKHHIHHGKADERECPVCGNVNPEQLFNIIDTKIVDEFGHLTTERKTSPIEWYTRFIEEKQFVTIPDRTNIPHTQTTHPSLLKQLSVFFNRDLLSKLSNRQYVLVTFLEAPLLAILLAFFLKYYISDENGHFRYSFYENENIPQYLFISVIVAVFLGLTVSAEEIFKDRKILKRESYLNLSRFGYLLAKSGILFLISAIQSLTFVLIGNYILEINGLFWHYWFLLFSTAFCSNILGLNISSAFNSAKVIYIFVPVFIIPQLLFSGAIVKFDKLNPVFSTTTEVPWVADLMISRWSYEALAVAQSTDNKYDRLFYKTNLKRYDASWKKDYWIPEMNHYLNVITDKKADKLTKLIAYRVLKNEIAKEETLWNNFNCDQCFVQKKIKPDNIRYFLDILQKQYTVTTNEAIAETQKIIDLTGEKKIQLLKDHYANASLHDLVTDRHESSKIAMYNDQLFRKDNPIYNRGKNGFFNTHFYAPEKKAGNLTLSTYTANVLVIWLFSLLAFFSIYLHVPEKLVSAIQVVLNKLIKKPLRN